MIIYPAIDLKDGQCVRLYQGSFDQVTTYPVHALEVAKNYALAGAEYLHLVNLNGAQAGTEINISLIEQLLAQTHLKIQIGGGIRDFSYAEKLLNLGVNRIVIGSMAVRHSAEIKKWLKIFGPEKIVLALDVKLNAEKIPFLATEGWAKDSQVSLWALLEEYAAAGIQHILCTDISCDGTLQGPNIELYAECLDRYGALQFQASGGVASLVDLSALNQLGLAGAVVGKALYEKKFSLLEAIEASQC